MGQPRSGTPLNAPDPFPEVIINRPELQSPVQRTLNRVLTLIAWAAYMYLWLPLLTLLFWWIGVSLGMHELQRTYLFIDADLFLILFKAAAIAAALLIGWAEYNRWRFQGHEDQRMPQINVTHSATAARLNTREEVAEALRHCRNGVVFFDNHAVAIGVRVRIALIDPKPKPLSLIP